MKETAAIRMVEKKDAARIRHLFVILILIGCSCRPGHETKPGLMAEEAMVVTAHPIASEAGKNILQIGGNAVDAAIAVQFALAVVYPAAGNIGGGGFMVIRLADGETATLDFREKAPLAATRDMYLDKNGEVINGLSRLGHLASGVPGTVDGMYKAFEKFGTLKWETLLQPAIDLASGGFPLTEKEAARLNRYQDEILKASTVKPGFLIKDQWRPGDSLIMKDLAGTLKRIRDKKSDGFYMGETAELLVKEMLRGNGLITREDLEKYEAVWRIPVTGQYDQYRIISMGPPSSGGIALLQMLKMAEPYDLKALGWHSFNYIHLLAEIEKKAFADRATHLGDKDFYPVPVDTLLSPSYLERRMKNFSFSKALPSDSLESGDIRWRESGQTTHFSIVDQFGNAVAVTTTLNGNFGARVVVGDAGFFLNNEMDDFSIKPGHPNMFGLIGGKANAIEPGKRMLSSMTPTIVEKGDTLFMVLGSPGGSRIITTVLQCILNVTEFEMTMQGSVNNPRFHHQWKPEKIFFEKERIKPRIRKILRENGHSLEEVNSIGRADAVRVTEGGQLEGAADPRGDDKALGF